MASLIGILASDREIERERDREIERERERERETGKYRVIEIKKDR